MHVVGWFFGGPALNETKCQKVSPTIISAQRRGSFNTMCIFDKFRPAKTKKSSPPYTGNRFASSYYSKYMFGVCALPGKGEPGFVFLINFITPPTPVHNTHHRRPRYPYYLVFDFN